jgi:hypothetical protein
MKKIAPEGTIKVQSNGTKWVKENGKWVYIKKHREKKVKYPSCPLPEYIPPPPKNIKLYPTKFDGYHVCEDGSIWTEWHTKGYARKMNQSFRGGCYNHDRYLSVNISLKDDNGNTVKQIKYYSHRLIAETLIENPHNYSEIDHINRDKLCNKISNLRWCDRKTNINNR